MSIPNNITKEHLLKAISKIDEEGIPKDGDSQYYDVIFNGEKYPPKMIVSYANLFANGEILDRNSFEGGIGTKCFKILSKNDFMIESKLENETAEPKVWFVTQGATFSKERGMKFLWAPKKNKKGSAIFFWNNVLKVRKGDIIFNYSGGLKGVSIALNDGYEAPNSEKESVWDATGYKVDIDLTELDIPIPLSEFKKKKEEIKQYLINVKNKPFDLNGNVNEGYLYEFSKEAGKFLRDLYGKPFGKKEIDDFFDEIVTTGHIENKMTINEIILHSYNYIRSLGFQYDYEEIANFYISLKAKPFVILAGISGTGKTQLPRKIAASLGFLEEQVIQLPVRPDWTDSSDILGYTSLDGNFIPKDLTLAIQKATANPDLPYFFILDEMNLARVEHYFSDFLSVIETRERVGKEIKTDPILREEVLRSAKNKADFSAMGWPQNLFLIGTVNMDETTHSFSRKVLDRANSVEMNEVDLNWIKTNGDQIPQLSGISNDLFQTDYIRSVELTDEDKKSIDKDMKLLQDVNKILQEADLHFAYRVRDEIAFYLIINAKNGLLQSNSALDFQIVQKILPRIHGSSERVQTVLVDLLNLLEGTSFRNSNFEYSMINDFTKSAVLKYKRASKKIIFMLKRYDDDRFTSFWL